jgi:hypothetical protein
MGLGSGAELPKVTRWSGRHFKPCLPESMTTAGWVTMILSIGFPISLLAFCLHRILSGSGRHARERVEEQCAKTRTRRP